MKFSSRLLAVLLCLLLTFLSLTACSIPEDTDTDDTENKKEITKEEVEEEEEPKYKWVIEPINIKGDIQPVYDMMDNKLYSCDVSFLNNGDTQSIIGYDGEIKCELPKEGFGPYNYCSVCECITNHIYRVTEPDYTAVENFGGHGGGAYIPYVYDKDTEELFKDERGYYTPVHGLEYAIVSISEKYKLSEEEAEWYNTDYGYRTVGGYGIVVDGKLVQEGFDMYTPYCCGTVAMRSDNGKWGYYDSEGNEIFSVEYDSCAIESYDINFELSNTVYHATEGILVLNKNGKWGFADTEGNMLTAFEFEEARPVNEANQAWVKTSEGWGVIEINYDYREDGNIAIADANACSGYIV